MIDVQFKSVSAGNCGWCSKEKEAVYDVVFSDQSFIGRLCKNDLLRAIGMKLSRSDSNRKPQAETTSDISSDDK
jgi:hypothetical protein